MKYILDLIADHINRNQLQQAYDLIITHEEKLIQNAEYWNLRGVICLKVEEYNAAISCLSKAIELDDQNGDLYYNYAYAMDKMGSQSDAALYYGKAYRYLMDPNIKHELAQLYSDNEALKNIFITASTESKRTYIILSSNVWSNVYQRTHHIARSLYKFGNEVMYVERKRTFTSEQGNIQIADLVNYSANSVKKIEGVNVYQTLEMLDKYGDSSVDNYLELVQYLLDSCLSQSKEVVIISYLPSQANTIKSLKGEFYHIYECVDDHSDLEYSFWGHKNDIYWEQDLMDSADAITTTATALYLQRSAIEGRNNVFLSRNAVNEFDFLEPSSGETPNDLINIPEPRVVYAGAIYEWFDFDLFNKVVESNPDKSFVIIGFGKTELINMDYPNLYFLGEKKHSELSRYLQYMQIGIIPFKDDINLIINCDPIKQYEYLACNLPVITTYMPEAILDKEYTIIAKGYNEFNKAISDSLILEIDGNVIENFISRNNWNVRAALLSNLASGAIDATKYVEIEKNKLEYQLGKLSTNYKSSVFLSLHSICLKFGNESKYQEGLKLAYENFRANNFVDTHYLISLIEKKDYVQFIQVYSKSKFLRRELLEELRYLLNIKDYSSIATLAYLSINDIKKFFENIEDIKNTSKQKEYKLYFEFSCNPNRKALEHSEIDYLKTSNDSPLYTFLLSQINNGETIYVSNIFNNYDGNSLRMLEKSGVHIAGYCSLNSSMSSDNRPVYSLKDVILKIRNNQNVKIIVLNDANYVKQIRILAENGIRECEVAVVSNSKLERVIIDNELMEKIKLKKYLNTVVFNKFNAVDSNVEAMLKYIPEDYRDKFDIQVIKGRDVYLTENVVKVPLIASVTVSGFSTFLYLPKFTYNIEIGHGGLPIKACGLMDKNDKNSGGNQQVYNNADVICVGSNMEQIVRSSFYAIPENKYRITGLARNDMLQLTDGKTNLEKLLQINLANKKIVFNMPTFHMDEKNNRIEGDRDLIDSFPISGFDYEKFNAFLSDNNMICVSKVHHGEEKTISSKTKNRSYSNLFFISNETLEVNKLDLYEILNAADILITDYSTVYNDFLFMDKPIVFVNTDIEDYREQRGLALEPYEFWTAGPKVNKQDQLHKELENCSLDKNYYKSEREKLLPLFFKHNDASSTQRTWDVINQAFNLLKAENNENYLKE
ncbi:CDP-glycerol glycerophosphotransferase family protein [uncultured Paenibacillus sp.]|uniref:CDP-glycerol glycerophosphotransferase family protein n=1 Tax=uncultured Paenibacillus sp. TaxID=227322 RepID=UPI0015B116B3|nr:CDP-glycerol glycerophosphotransferase family protein [uncultured Paenibacillus sp.]